MSFGGPERPEDVMPFLENVTRGRGIPTERLAEVGRHYLLFGGKSPINDQCRRLLGGIDERITPPWHTAAALLGEPELDALP